MSNRNLCALGRLAFSIAIAPIIIALTINPALAQSELQLVFGVYASDKPTVLVESYRPILSAIETNLGKKLNRPVAIRLQVAASYELGVLAISNGDVDFSLLGPASYIAAYKSNSSIRIIALESKNDELTSKGIIAVKEDSVYDEISDLKGARFAFGNERSTVGRYLSQAYLLKHGVSAEDITHYEYLGRHDRVGYAIAQGTFDAGALKEGTFNKLKEKGLPLRALAQFENVNKPWIAKSDMDDNLFQMLRTVMLELEAPAAFKALGKKQFVLGDNSDFSDILQAVDTNEHFFNTVEKNNSTATCSR